MSNKISKPLFFVLSFAFLMVLYWPSMNGRPVWDDISFLFGHPTIIGDFPYLTILKDFAWPVSVLAQKLSFSVFGKNYFLYHLMNVIFHFINACLLLKVAEKFKLPYSRLLFLFFLFHPSNVITVSWIIQFKTLICFFFGILSFWFLLKGTEQRRNYIFSLLFFSLSLFSKSASIPLPLFYFFYLWFNAPKKSLLWLIPFLLVSLFGAYRILKSPVTEVSVARLERSQTASLIDAETSSKIKKPEKVVPPPAPPEGIPPKIVEKLEKKPSTIVSSDMKWVKKAKLRWNTFLGTVHYYFWQTLMPLRNEPVKGQLYTSAGFQEYLHLVFITIMLIIHWGTAIPFFLLAGYLMTLPFLGLFPAPYMNLTWVSDQHLYLAIPFFICFWLTLITRWKYKFSAYLPYALIPGYCFLVITTTPYYKDEITFYRAGLEADALNVPIAYNLAIAHIHRGEINDALNVTSTIIHMSQVAPEILQNQYFNYLFILHLELERYDGTKK